ncbi:butyrophilin-like protein 2 [Archocentrus centrarchus]|uniref:butyrophilin-like protein 2 n=1 Tax=Archocentrus centrarchus TaxID=63155 RepID=UPI0011EA432F|nr:butyrophilin-like protein 2 [Archocentrus centrarchus]
MSVIQSQSEVVGPLQPVVSLIGDDVILPCHLDPVMDAFDMTLEWARPDLDPRFVIVWRDGVDLESKKHPLYNNRTSLFTNELQSGNISLKISKVKQSDGGTYICFVPELKRDAAVRLVVGAVSSPVAQMNRTSSRVVLQCESAGWYPEPELLWLDGEGNLLPAGPTETLRGPDDLYTVSSRVTVEKRHSNNITCRVQQKIINQSRETHIHVQGKSAVIGPLQPIVATVGDDIILPRYLYPSADASDMTVEWTRPDLESRLVHVWPERAELQNPSYKGRTSLFTDELKHGNISLKISKIKLSDEGTYRCFIPDLQRDSAVRLVVGAASSPVAKMNRTSSRVVLQCESAGWYPEPELLWLDAEGNLLSAGPTETLRGPDDLYTVSSRVTVEKRHSNNITCRVQQKIINQSRETHIHVPDDVFMVISPSSPPSDTTIAPTIDSNTITGLAIGAVVVLVLILAVSCVVWKQRRFKCSRE